MKTVLVVDDDRAVRELLEAILKHLGFNVLARENGREAASYIEEADALITDFQMPLMDGIQLIGIAKHLRPRLPMLLVTGDPNDVPEEHPDYDMILKPYKTAQIMGWLHKVGMME